MKIDQNQIPFASTRWNKPLMFQICINDYRWGSDFFPRPNPMKILVKPINICPNSLPIFSGKLCWKRLCVRGRKHGQTMVSIVDSPNKTFASHMAGPRHDLGGATGRSSRWPRSLAIPGFKASCIANKREDWHGQLTLIQHLPIVINW